MIPLNPYHCPVTHVNDTACWVALYLVHMSSGWLLSHGILQTNLNYVPGQQGGTMTISRYSDKIKGTIKTSLLYNHVILVANCFTEKMFA
jgi:hypothetical protein